MMNTAPARIVAAISALAFAAGAWYLTSARGPGLHPDSMSYLGAARSFVAHGTFRRPSGAWWSDSTSMTLVQFPPGYSTAIALPVALGVNAVQSARVVQIVAAGATAACFVLTLAPVVGTLGAALGVIALAVTPSFQSVQIAILSEPLYVAIWVLLLWYMVRRPRAALTHGVIAAAATMVRYAGLSSAGAAALWALRDVTASWRTRLTRAALAVGPSLIAFGAWSITRQHAADGAGPVRNYAWYGDWGPTLREGARTIAHHLVPSTELEPAARLASAVALAALGALTWSTVRLSGEVLPAPAQRHPRWFAQCDVLWALGVLAVSYIAVVCASRLTADPDIPFDYRIFAPLAVLAVAAVTIVAARAWRVITPYARVIGVLAFGGWLALAASASARLITDVHANGVDYDAPKWSNSPTLQWVRTHGASHAIFSNRPYLIFFYCDRQSREVPEDTDAETIRRFAEKVRAADGVVAAWKPSAGDAAVTDTIAVRAGLLPVAQLADGTIYAMAPTAVRR